MEYLINTNTFWYFLTESTLFRKIKKSPPDMAGIDSFNVWAVPDGHRDAQACLSAAQAFWLPDASPSAVQVCDGDDGGVSAAAQVCDSGGGAPAAAQACDDGGDRVREPHIHT